MKNKINVDIKKALIQKDQATLETLRFLSAQIKDKEIEKGKQELTQEELDSLISQQIKKAQESLEHFKNSGRTELVEKAEKEISILKSYLPEQMPEEELKQEIKKIMEENKNINQPGPLIGQAVKKLGSKADNQTIARLIMQEFKKQTG